MKAIRRISKKYYLRQIVACWSICAMLLAFSPARVAMAKPSYPVLKYGNAVFTELPNGFEVSVNGMKHIIHWNSLNTDWNEFLRFYGPSGAAVLNRVMNGLKTNFNGELTGAGMKIFIVNPAGVVFGKSAKINVAQLIASSLDISDSDFLADRMIFGKLPDNYALEDYKGDVVFNADTSCSDLLPERIYLISGKNVCNNGYLKASDLVVMAAGENVIITENPGSPVVVQTDMSAGHQLWNKGCGIKVDESLAGEDGDGSAQVVLAAGDIWSSAFVGAYSNGGSDAVATIDVAGAGDVTIADDMEAEAMGNGVDDATAKIGVTAGGNLTVESGGSSGTELEAKASEGLNNTADVTLNADGAFTIDAPDKVTVKAEAASQCNPANLNKANVNIKGSSVLITGTDLGSTDEPATVKAYAHDAMVNRAGVDIEATECDAKIIGAGSNGDSAIVLAKAKNGSENYANVGIKAAGDVDIIAKKGQPTTGDDATKAVVLAKAENTCEPGLINEAGVDITAGRDVKIMSEGGNLYYEIYVYDRFHGWHWESVTEIPEWYEGETKAHFTPYEAKVMAIAKNAVKNTANVGIDAGRDVKVIAKDGGIAKVLAITDGYGEENTSGVTVNAGGDVKVLALDGATEVWQEEVIESWEVKIKKLTETWDVHVKKWHDGYWDQEYVHGHWEGHGFDRHWVPGHWEDVWHDGYWETDKINNCPEYTPNLEDYGFGGWTIDYRNDHKTHWDYDWMHEQSTQTPTPPEGWVLAGDTTPNYDYIDHSRFNPSEALIMAKAENAGENTATVGIDAVGGDVVVLGKDGGDAGITALAKNALTPSTNNAKVNITATKVDVTEMQQVSGQDTPEDKTDDVFEEVVVGTEGGNVKVIADCKGQPSEAEIEALAIGDDTTNNADVLICVDGGVKVKGEEGGKAEIEALAKGWDSTNTATVGIGARGEEGVEVIAEKGGKAGISSKAKDGFENTASTIICTAGGVDVIAAKGGDAEILAQAKSGYDNDAFVGVCAVGDVKVGAYKGGDAVIRSEAESYIMAYLDSGYTAAPPVDEVEQIIPTNKAETVVISRRGNVEVEAYKGSFSGIEAEAQGGHQNTAKVGVAAGADLSPEDVIKFPEEIPDGVEAASPGGYEGPWYTNGNVTVKAGKGSEAQIYAFAHDAMPIFVPSDTDTSEGPQGEWIPGENTASVVICAPGKVKVKADESSEARIKSRAGWFGDEESINNAKTQVYASEVKVRVDSLYHGQGIWAYAQGVGNQHVDSHYCLTDQGLVAEIVTNENGSAELIINDYSQRTDCPTCPPCPCEQGAAPAPSAAAPAPEVPAPVAPLPPYFIPRVEGCPQLTQAAAAELGIPDETLQVGMGNALAINPNLQPCQACASLLNAASILKDVDGSRMAAMLQVFNSMAPADAPYTPEMATSIATAFDNAAEGSQYASAMEFVDAFVQYAAALDAMGSPEGDSTAYVMGKYGQGLSQNSNMATFVAGRVESGQTF